MSTTFEEMIKAVTNNPYRALGLLSGASNREITRQTNNLKKYLSASAELPVDFSFSKLDNFIRSEKDIETASAEIDTDEEKMFSSLFWFWKGNEITDEPAFEAMKEGDFDTAYQIWDRLITETKDDGKRFWKSVTERNFSAFHNYSVANLLKKNDILYGVMANIHFIESDYFSDFTKATVDVTYTVRKKDIERKFLDEIVNDITAKNINISLIQLVKYLKDYDFVAKADFLKGISQKFTANSTAQIEIARKACAANKQNAATAGETLYNNTKNDLVQLKEIFGATDFSYSNMADKVANEILQCSIDFFNDSQEKGLENGYTENALKLVKLAENIAVGSATKGRIKENLQIMEEMQFKALQVLKAVKQIYDMCQWNQTINSGKVVEMISQAITLQDVSSIKSSTNAVKIEEYKQLINFLKNQLGSYYWGKVKFLSWWEIATNSSTTKVSTSTTSRYIPPSTKKKWYDKSYSEFICPDWLLPAYWDDKVGGWMLLLWPIWIVQYGIATLWLYTCMLFIPLWIIYNIIASIAKAIDN